MVIVIPLAGESRRFAEAGYQKPKYALPLGGATVFDHAVGSFAHYFQSHPFLFVCRAGGDAPAFVAAACARLGIADPRIVALPHPTRGQAETVVLGMDEAGIGNGEAITIFNIDTFRPHFRFPDGLLESGVDGYLEVFRGSGPNWSYVRPDPVDSGRVAETAEKVEISDLCCTGLYHFARAGDFQDALTAAGPAEGELYVAPLYNHLIGRGRRVGYHLIGRDQVRFCGMPEEYEALRKSIG